MRANAFLLIFLFFLSPALHAEEGARSPNSEGARRPNSEGARSPLGPLLDATMSFFKPLSGSVLSVQDGLIGTDIADGLKEAMRLSVLRKGKPYEHPVTKEPIGALETPVGTAEVRDGKIVLLKGEAVIGDILRVSSARVKALFYQSPEVSWGIAEEYYGSLKETGRFQLIDSRSKSEERLKPEAEEVGADVVLVLNAEEAEGGVLLRQRLLWAGDMKQIASLELRLEDAYVRELKFGEEFFAPPKEPYLVFDMPFPVRFITAGDLDGDGVLELIMSTGKNIYFYTSGKTLKPALDDAEIKGKWSEPHIRLDSADSDGDGKDEVLVVVMAGSRVRSYLYSWKDGGFAETRRWDFFVRALPAGLYGQKYSSLSGFKGEVFPIEDAPPVELPKGINLYDFLLFGSGYILVYDEAGYLNLYDQKGLRLWRSKEDYGGPLQSFELEPPTVMAPRESWTIKDRLVPAGKNALVIKRIPVAPMSRGLGFKHSELTVLRPSGISVEERTLIGYIPDKAVDFALGKDSVFVVSENVSLMKVFKGMGFLARKIYVFPLGGKRDAVVR